ncbi:MAG: hypothetical protein WCT04_08785 [Planctomycetota bacterium]
MSDYAVCRKQIIEAAALNDQPGPLFPRGDGRRREPLPMPADWKLKTLAP